MLKNVGASYPLFWCLVPPVKNHCFCLTNVKLNCIPYRVRFLQSALIVMHYYVIIIAFSKILERKVLDTLLNL